MSKGGGWVPMDKNLKQEFKYINRPFSRIEAIFSFTLDIDCGREWSIKGYAKLWQWSRNKVRKLVSELRTDKGHTLDRHRTHFGHPIHFIDKGLWPTKDTLGTDKGHPLDTLRYPTSNPNPNPNKKIKNIYGSLENVLLTEGEHKKLLDKFNSSTDDKINALSEYISSKGKKYNSHYATILSWDRNDKKKAQNKPSNGYAEPTPEKNYREGL